MSSAIMVFFIQKLHAPASSKTNSMPLSGASRSRNISPLARLAGVSATSARMRVPVGWVIVMSGGSAGKRGGGRRAGGGKGGCPGIEAGVIGEVWCVGQGGGGGGWVRVGK